MLEPNVDYLYEIIGILSKADLPIVFKGANVTNALLMEANSPYIRRTTDIDSSWHGINPTTENIEEMLREALLPYGYNVVKVRELDGIHQSAGFKILKNDLPITKIDIDIHKVNEYKAYSVGTVEFNGVLLEDILVDKLCCASKPQIYRRVKDIMDIYSLTQTAEIRINKIFDKIKASDNELADFHEFLTNKDKIREAYDNLKAINKPDFDNVYSCLVNYANELNELRKND